MKESPESDYEVNLVFGVRRFIERLNPYVYYKSDFRQSFTWRRIALRFKAQLATILGSSDPISAASD